MAAIYALWMREILRCTRARSQLIAFLGQPVLYLFVLGFGLNGVFRESGRGDYIQFVAPGIVAMTVLYAASYSGMSLLFDRQFGFIKETLVAPVPRVLIVVGQASGIASVALLQGALVGVVCVIAGFRCSSAALLPEGMGFVVLVAFVFAGVGLALGATLKQAQGFQLAMSYLIAPIFLLSGALFPQDKLPRALWILTRLDPLAYGVDGIRGALLGQWQFGPGTDAVVLLALAVMFIALAAWRFSKVEV